MEKVWVLFWIGGVFRIGGEVFAQALVFFGDGRVGGVDGPGDGLFAWGVVGSGGEVFEAFG